MDPRRYRVLFLTLTAVLALSAASPALERLLALPRTEFFTEFWILSSNHKADGYPFNMTRNQNYSVVLGIGNHLGYCAYYSVQVKFRNQTQPAPDSLNGTASSMQPLFNITAFVGDNGVWELPVTFSFDFSFNPTLSRMAFYSLTLNNITREMRERSYLVTWDSGRKMFPSNLFFELWLHNTSSRSFQYHDRYVGIWLNATV